MSSTNPRIIFLHGVGSNGAAMAPLGEALGVLDHAAFPDGPQPFDMGAGRQWFSVKGVTEANRPRRIADAMPAFIDLIERFGDPRNAVLVGFSQGAIMALHAVAAGVPVVGVIALSGRLAGRISPRSDWPTITLLHGTNDPVMPLAVARATEVWLQDAGAAPRLTMFDGLGHEIDARVLEAIGDTPSPTGGRTTHLSS
ncbi:hypothetical protein [Paracoccus niistensis]|uniref:Phospholipase/carboxylesterase/thioesterase domain-containing protein n=1 Tax=Paracoccus niistensis TaxID=632935 RepID=A0ABV6I568_9RHOB